MQIVERAHSVAVAGGELNVREWAPQGIDTRAPVILLHDSIGCAEMWRAFPRALAASLGRRVIAYDRLGYGRSSAQMRLPTVRFVNEEAELFFPCILKSLGVKQFIAFGHSVGGAMAAIVAARFGQRCQALITESAQAFVEQRTLDAIAAAKVKFSDPRELAKLERYHGNKARWVVDAWTDTWLSESFRDWSIVSDLPAVRCPLLAIHGDADEYGSIDFPTTFTSMVSGASQAQILSNCGHVPHREREGEVLRIVREFIERVPLP